VNKTQLISQVARKARISKTSARMVVNACFVAIKSSAATRNGVTIAGFGRFWCNQEAGRRVYNARTRRSVWRRGETTVHFSPMAGW
jgi:nucleoid DNA-binding protein